MRPVTVSLLLVSDDSAANSLERTLHSLGFDVRWCESGPNAIESAIRSPPNLVLFDGRSHPLSSIQLCRSLRSIDEISNLPAVVLAGDASAQERLAMLEAGADDCWTEAVDSREFLLRLKGFARRFEAPPASRILRYADVELDVERYKVRRNGVPIELHAMQFKLLRHLMENSTIVVSLSQLREQVWHNPDVDEGAVRACIGRLRRALMADGGPDLIKNVPGAGYSIDGERLNARPASRRKVRRRSLNRHNRHTRQS